MTHSEQFIDIGIGTKSDVLANTVERCQKVNFDNYSLRKPEKVYDSYKIPRFEKIIAYCKSSILGLTINGIVFTNKAFYFSPNDEKANKILYTELCSYIVTREFDKSNGNYLCEHGGVYLRNMVNEIEVFGGTLIVKNVAAEEVFKILTNIQKELCAKNSKSQIAMDATIEHIFSEFKLKMKYGKVKSADTILLKVLLTNQKYAEDAILLLAENRYRLSNFGNYYKLISEIPISNPNLKQRLKQPRKLFYQNFINDLFDLSNLADKDYLNRVYKNLSKREKLQKEDKIISSLISIKLHKFSVAKGMMSTIANEHGKDSCRQIENYLFLYGNSIMSDVLYDIEKGNNIDIINTDIADGLGLTPLHYAIIYGSDKYVKQILDLTNWSKTVPKTNDTDLSFAYNYALLAAKKGKRYVNQIITSIDPEIVELNYTLKDLEEQAEQANESMKNINRCLWEGRRNLTKLENEGAGYGVLSDVRESINDLENSLRQVEQVFYECIEKIPIVREEIYKKAKEKEKIIFDALARLSKSENSLIKLLFNLYENHSESINIKKFVSHKDKLKIYTYNDFSFAVPYDINLNFSYRIISIGLDNEICDNESQPTDENDTSNSPVKIFGTSWFSQEAHNNMSLLNSEYRALAKKYHPDVCEQKYSSQVFVEIADEYNMIKEELLQVL